MKVSPIWLRKRVWSAAIHISTDFVFDGSASTPYSPEDKTSPLSVYGPNQARGEIATGPDAPGVHYRNMVPGPKFRLDHAQDDAGARSGNRVVDDQIGTPTALPRWQEQSGRYWRPMSAASGISPIAVLRAGMILLWP